MTEIHYQAMMCPNCGPSFGWLSANLSLRCTKVSVKWIVIGQEKAKDGTPHNVYRREFLDSEDGCGLKLYLCGSCGQRDATIKPGGIISCKCGMVRNRTPEDQLRDSQPWSGQVVYENRKEGGFVDAIV